ncbi:hypothetical protein [Paenibacillus solani]|uniref:hypothetical protein n=1 Tax=Paenibacillus solani TaxID=1705565 RepID=UPI003D26526C
MVNRDRTGWSNIICRYAKIRYNAISAQRGISQIEKNDIKETNDYAYVDAKIIKIQIAPQRIQADENPVVHNPKAI